MVLKKLTINDFKSYAGEVVIPYDETPSVAVVGPNGSGKSNLLDAICFVSGMSLRRLRAERIESLVHKSATKNAMFVEAVVQRPTIPALDYAGSLPTEVEPEIIVFKRTSTEFLVNHIPVTEDAYLHEWAKLNVFPEAHNCVVLQNDIDSLAQADPLRLARLIENLQPADLLAEIQADRARYVELESQLAAAAQESRKYLDARRTAQSRIDEAESLSTSTEKLETMRAQLQKLKSRRKALALAEKRATLHQLKSQIRSAHSDVTSCRTDVELMDADTRRLRTEYARKRKQLQAARVAEQEAAQAVAAQETEVAPLERKRAAVDTEIRLQEPDLEYSKQSVASAQREVDQATRALNLLDRTHDTERANIERENDGLTSLAPSLQELWTRTEADFLVKTALQQDIIDRCGLAADAKERQLLSAQHEADDHESEVESTRSRQQQQELRVKQLEAALEERESQLEERRDELEGIGELTQTLRREQQEIAEKLKELNERVRRVDGDKRALAQRHRLLDTVERLRRAHAGVFDLLGNLVTPVEERFSVALEYGLGPWGDAVVVDTPETAMACIQQSRRERLGRLSYLPLSDLQGRDLATSRALLARKSVDGLDARLLLDCARFEQRFRPAVLYVLRNTAFVTDFTTGMSLRRSGAEMRIIDMHGSVISRNNVVTTTYGGAEHSKSGGLSDRSLAAMQRKIVSLAERLRAAATEESEMGDREIKLTSQIERSAQMVDYSKKELDTAKQQLDSTIRALRHLESQTHAFSQRVTNAEQATEQAQVELRKEREKLGGVRAQMFAEFVKEAGGSLKDWDARLTRGTHRLTELSSQRYALEERLRLATEQFDIVRKQFERQQQRQKTLEAAQERIEAQLSAASSELSTATHKLERAQARVRTLKSETESRSDEMGASEAAAEEARARMTNAEREEHRRAMVLAAEVSEEEKDDADDSTEDSDVEMEDSGREDTQPNIEPTDANERRRLRHSRRREAQSAASPNPQRTRKRTRNTTGELPSSNTASVEFNDTETLSLDRLDAKIHDLQAEMEPLVTLMTMIKSKGPGKRGEEVARATQVCAELEKSADELRTRSNKVTEQSNSLRKTRTDRIYPVLARLEVELSSVYRELVGGDAQAKLTVIEKDAPFNGIEFMVMPPNKPFTRVSQLSGGEQCMAVLALLFACHKLYPAPFMALDEVDAVLDFINIASLANYIHEHHDTTQFIVISLKQRLFQTVSHLVGVYKERLESKILTLTL